MSAAATASTRPMHLHEKVGEVAHQAYYPSAPVISKIGCGIANIARNIDQGIWKDRAIHKIDQWDAKLERALPNSIYQEKLDQLGRYIQKKFAPLEKFNTWLNSNGNGAWDLKLATFLVKLPLRVARNIINLLFQVIKGVLYFIVHPLKSINALAKLIVKLMHELTKPETMTLMGAGVMGAGFGQTAVTGNIFSLIGVAIGGAMIISGLGLGALKAAIKAEKGKKWNAAIQNIKDQAIQIPESLLTGLCMGAMIGGIQKSLNSSYRVSSDSEARKFADQFAKENNLPRPAYVFENDGMIRASWHDPNGDLYRRFPQLFPEANGKPPIWNTQYMEFYPDKPAQIHVYGRYAPEIGFPYRSGRPFCHSASLNELGFKTRIYPNIPGDDALTLTGPTVGNIAPFIDTRRFV